MDDLVSIVIPVYNGEAYIEECLDSIFRQTVSNYEIIIVDDGSTDSSVQKVLNINSDKICLIKQSNGGSAAARNNGIKNANGKWIAFLDADDLWMPEKLEKQLSAIKNSSWAYTDSFFLGEIYPKNTKTSDLAKFHTGSILEELVISNFIGTSTVLLERKLFEEVGYFDTSLRALQDWDLWLRVAKKHEIALVDEPLGYYRLHSSSVSRAARKTIKFHVALIDKIYATHGVGAHLEHLKAQSLSRSYNICSIISEQEDDYVFSFSCLIKSLRYDLISVRKILRLGMLGVKAVLFKLGISFSPD
jgi:glycosyltransferase involved in cell wall biosynthesis